MHEKGPGLAGRIKKLLIPHQDKIRFLASSGISFVVDYSLYSVMILLTRDLSAATAVTVSNITARVISSVINFTINRKFVFRSDKSVARSAAGYFTLAAGILAANTLLLNLLTRYVLQKKMISKILVEGFLFCVNWLIQRYVIFRKKTGEGPGGS